MAQVPGVPDGVPDSWLQLSPAPAVAFIWAMNQWTEKSLFFFLCPFFISVYLSNKCLLKDKNLKIIVKIKGPAAEVPRRGEEAWRMGVSRVLTVVQPPF